MTLIEKMKLHKLNLRQVQAVLNAHCRRRKYYENRLNEAVLFFNDSKDAFQAKKALKKQDEEEKEIENYLKDLECALEEKRERRRR